LDIGGKRTCKISKAVPRSRAQQYYNLHREMNILNKSLVFLIAGWSGFFVMAVELLSGRILAPNFGSSIYVWGGIITIFMLALSIGYLIGGRLSIREPSLRKLSVILMVAAVTTTPVVLFSDNLLDRIFTLIQDPRYGSLISATILFFLPTMISGIISPYAVRLLVTESNQSGHFAGLLYFVSTFGSGDYSDLLLPCTLF
jgi:hypothetical protein